MNPNLEVEKNPLNEFSPRTQNINQIGDELELAVFSNSQKKSSHKKVTFKEPVSGTKSKISTILLEDSILENELDKKIDLKDDKLSQDLAKSEVLEEPLVNCGKDMIENPMEIETPCE